MSDKMCPCDLLLAGAMETFSPNQKQIAISSCSSSEIVLLLNFKIVQFCCLSSKVLKKRQGEFFKSSRVLFISPQYIHMEKEKN